MVVWLCTCGTGFECQINWAFVVLQDFEPLVLESARPLHGPSSSGMSLDVTLLGVLLH